MRRTILSCVLLGLIGAGAFVAQTSNSKLPPLKTRSGPQAVVDEHLDALNKCDWNRLMAQYPPNVEFYVPGGQVIKGREQIGELFRSMVKPFKEGGLCGVKFTVEHSSVVGNTVNAQWSANADFLREPYKGSDAYVTDKGLMAAQVTTFQRDQLKAK